MLFDLEIIEIRQENSKINTYSMIEVVKLNRKFNLEKSKVEILINNRKK